jgi:hypothetical protein
MPHPRIPSSLLGIPRMRNVVYDPSDPHDRLVLFRVTDEGIVFISHDLLINLVNVIWKEAKLPPEARDFVLKEGQGQFTDYTLKLDYDYWTAGVQFLFVMTWI